VNGVHDMGGMDGFGDPNRQRAPRIWNNEVHVGRGGIRAEREGEEARRRDARFHREEDRADADGDRKEQHTQHREEAERRALRRSVQLQRAFAAAALDGQPPLGIVVREAAPGEARLAIGRFDAIDPHAVAEFDRIVGGRGLGAVCRFLSGRRFAARRPNAAREDDGLFRHVDDDAVAVGGPA